MSGGAAADDLMGRLEAIKESLAGTEGPHVVSIILDGENAWENYANDGKDFLNAHVHQPVGRRMVGNDHSRANTSNDTVKPSRTSQTMSGPAPGSRRTTRPGLGRPEEATAWDYLYQTRQDLHRAETLGDAEAIRRRVRQDALRRRLGLVLVVRGRSGFGKRRLLRPAHTASYSVRSTTRSARIGPDSFRCRSFRSQPSFPTRARAN